jgi:hypothetical protein
VTKQHPNSVLYCQLMEAIKQRTDVVLLNTRMLGGNCHYMGVNFVAEFCLLQLRFCCELLALGCVAIHTDAPSTKKLEKEWNAEQIMKAFEKIKPKFFPKAIKSAPMPNGSVDQQPVTGSLTKEEFVKMYSFIGKMLHSGTLRSLKTQNSQRYDIKIIDDFMGKLIKLLEDHIYLLYDEKRMIRVIMNNVADGKVWMNELLRTELLEQQP